MTTIPNPGTASGIVSVIDPMATFGPDLLAKFRLEYSEALEQARVSSEHTATEGWRRLYAGERNDDLSTRRKLAQRLKQLAERLEDQGLNDDEVKELGGLKTLVVEASDRKFHFSLCTVGPIIQSVRACGRIAENFRNLARREEAEAPLHQAGLEERMRREISLQPVPTWDDQVGQVLIRMPL